MRAALLSILLTGCGRYEGDRCMSITNKTRISDLPVKEPIDSLPPITTFHRLTGQNGQEPIPRTEDFACCLTRTQTTVCKVDCDAYRNSISKVLLGEPYDGEACFKSGSPIGGGRCTVYFVRDTGLVVATQSFCQI